jgi:hypothetical protein
MRRTILPLMLFVAAACQPARTELAEDQKTQIAAEVDSLTQEWWAAWEVFDFDRGLSFIYDGPDMVWTGAGTRTVYSSAEGREVWGPGVAGLQRQDLEFTNSRTVVLSADIVWTLREGNYVAVDTTGNVAAEGRFIETAVWVKRNGQWKVLLGHDDEVTEAN